MAARHKHPKILKTWIAALERAQPVLGLGHWDIYADVVERLRGVAANGLKKPEHAEVIRSHTPETAHVALSMLAIRNRVDLDFLAGHELAHVRLDGLKTAARIPDEWWDEEPFRRFEEAVCDLIAQCIRRAKGR